MAPHSEKLDAEARHNAPDVAEAERPLGLTAEETEAVRAHLQRLYAGVFTDEAIEGHLKSWVGWPAAQWAIDVVAPLVPAGGRILDIGCGYGSFVMLALERGYEARGFDLAGFEVDMARRRLGRLYPALAPGEVFRIGDATALAAGAERFDGVTMWNVLEHVPDHRKLIADAARLLKPGGRMFLVCPNYLARRLEAHYHVPWHPWLRFSRAWGRRRILAHGRNPAFFDNHIYYTTNWSVLSALRRAGLAVSTIDGSLALSRDGWSTGLWRRHGRLILHFLNPFAESVVLMAQRAGRT